MLLATSIDMPNLPQHFYSVAPESPVVAEPSTQTYLDSLSKGIGDLFVGTSFTITLELIDSSMVARDSVAEAFKPKTEFGKRLLALRRAYIEKGGKLLDADALEQELRQRRGGVTNA